MEIRSAEFVKGVIGSEGLPKPSRPTIAFFGRSNVGKSSLINSLTQRRDLAHANSRAGRTTEINYFLINDSWYMADLPGYGYARVPMAQKIKMQKYIAWYAADLDIDLRYAVLVVDAEVGATDSDRHTYRLLLEYGRHMLIVANKCDKGGRIDMSKHIKALETEFSPTRVVRYSSKTGEGRDELLGILFRKKKPVLQR